MNRKSMLTIGVTTVWLAVLGGYAMSAQDKYTVKVPGGLAFSEFRGCLLRRELGEKLRFELVSVRSAGGGRAARRSYR
jgi:hypothetical protein